MAGGLFNRIKIWAFEEVLKSKDLNTEFDNIINHLSPSFIASFSQTVGQMQTQLNPGDLGTEVPAQSLAQEIEQLRFTIARITGLSFWYQAPALSLAQIAAIVTQGNKIPQDRIVSGRERTTSAQSIFLVPNGTTPQVTLKASITPFVYYVAGTQYTINSDVNLSGISPAPGSGNTCLVNDAFLTGQPASFTAGETDAPIPTITVDTMGAAIVSKVGQFAAFYTGTEYFIAYVKSATELTKAFRGYFFDSGDIPLSRVALSDNQVITLAKLTWVFARTDGTLSSTQNPPSYSFVAPQSPAVGDYWFDFTAMIWKIFTGSSFVDSTAILIGVAALDNVGAKAARSFEFFNVYEKQNSVLLEFVDSLNVRSSEYQSSVSVNGSLFSWGHDFVVWSMSTDLDTGVTSNPSTIYYLYVTEKGDVKISDVKPFDRTGDLLGLYHPFNPWRCVGSVSNDSGSFFVPDSVDSYSEFRAIPNTQSNYVPTGVFLPHGGTTIPSGYLLCDGSSVEIESYPRLAGALFDRTSSLYSWGSADSTHFNVPDIRGRFLRMIDMGAGNDPDTGSRVAINPNGNVGDAIGSLQSDEVVSHVHGYAAGTPSSFLNGTGANLAKVDPSGVNANTTAFGGSETRPKNAYCYYIIKT